ncbi:MAG: hypothetical protein PHY05_07680 [Methanothrix sp.]|nr:hypothetical protein [Methanothrix sp.]
MRTKVLLTHLAISLILYVYAVCDKVSGIKPRNGPHGQGTNGGIDGELWWNIERWQKE